jgi:hypothetical protein
LRLNKFNNSKRSIQFEFIASDLEFHPIKGQSSANVKFERIDAMNVIVKTLIASTALVATAITPVSGAFAAGFYNKPPSGKHYVHKGGPGYHYQKGPKASYPRGYNKHRPPVIVHKGKNNAAAIGLLGFAAGAIVGGALTR